jgi:hypothetical protein
MKKRLLLVVVLGLGTEALSPAAAPQAVARNKPSVVRQQPAGDYERCAEDCPLPGLSATPAEVWCVTRVQCTSQEGCGCRLFKRPSNTQTFDYEAEAEVHVPREPGYGYVCWCTKPKAP